MEGEGDITLTLTLTPYPNPNQRFPFPWPASVPLPLAYYWLDDAEVSSNPNPNPNQLCCYNPLWLRLAAEAVSGEAAPPQSLDDTHALRRYLDRRVFAAPTYAPPAAAGRHPELAAQQA